MPSFGGAACISCRALDKSRYDVALPSPISHVRAHILADLCQGCYCNISVPVPEEAWHHITADRIVGLPKTKRGNTAILVVVDRLTKMTRIGACKDTCTAEDLARLFVDMVWKLHGMPRYIATDRGPEFTNKFVAHILAMLGTKHCKVNGLPSSIRWPDCAHEQSAGRHAAALCQSQAE